MSEENGAFAAASRVLRDRSQRLRERLRGGTWAFLALCSAAIALQAVIGAPFTGGDQPQVAEKSLAPDGPSGSSEATLALARQIATLRELAENLSLQQIEVRTRLTSLEGQLDSVTGSIAPRHAGTPSMPAPDSAALPAAPAAAPEAEKMLPESADGSARVMATEFAVELTKAPDLAAIESSWQALGRIYGAELNGLKAVYGDGRTVELNSVISSLNLHYADYALHEERNGSVAVAGSTAVLANGTTVKTEDHFITQ